MSITLQVPASFSVLVSAILAIALFPSPVLADTVAPLPAKETLEWGCIEVINSDDRPETRCGYGYWRTLCGWNAGVEECETFFELVEQEGSAETAVSNVLFMPGIKGSRLYRPVPSCDGPPDACAVKLWEPYGNAVARQLFLDDRGRSAFPDVYARAGDILSAALGQRFYASFVTDLDDAAIGDRYGERWRWEAAAYDWRLSLPDIVTYGDREDDRVYFTRAGTTPYLETQLRELAAASPTGKVTIIAHSNGGLVAKSLMAKLGDAEATRLVDTVIFVGVPHFGAPQALGALLFGHGEALPFDSCATWRIGGSACAVLMDRSTARTFAKHAPMAYHLLPSRAYFEELAASADPAHHVATFNGYDRYRAEQSAYGMTIDSESELHAYASAQDGGRDAPPEADIGRANLLSSQLLAYARDVHDRLDGWRAPAGIITHHVIGHGKETIAGIEFYEEPAALGLLGEALPRYRPTFLFAGDGVVPSLSAHGVREPEPIPLSLRTPMRTIAGSAVPGATTVSTRRYWIDLAAANAGRIGSGYGHGTLFEIDSVRQLLGDLIAARGTAPQLPPYIYESEPAMPQARSWLRIFLHSPLTLELYAGDRHLGVSGDGSFDDEIPGATYDEFGEVKYITVPAGEEYEVVMRGYGTGRFSLDIQEDDGKHSTTTTVSQVPVSAGLVARMLLPASAPSATSLALDRNGDGTVEERISLVPGTALPYAPADESQDLSRRDHSERPTPARRAIGDDRNDVARTSADASSFPDAGPHEPVGQESMVRPYLPDDTYIGTADTNDAGQSTGLESGIIAVASSTQGVLDDGPPKANRKWPFGIPLAGSVLAVCALVVLWKWRSRRDRRRHQTPTIRR